MRLSQTDEALTGVEGPDQYRAQRIEPACIGGDRRVSQVAEKAGPAIRRSKDQ